MNIGDKAIDFTLPNADGENVSLSDYRGRKVVLYFYPKDMTSGCTQEAVDFAAFYEDIVDNGGVVIGISKDSVQSHVRFRDKYSLPFILLSDESLEVIKAYGVWQEKKLYGKPYMGVVRTTFIIDEDGVITHRYDKVKVAGHAENVACALRGER